jgi:phosphatidylserine/phosphatidylglycerophosphate/cardiolipin synthase-like enzyme
MSDKWLRLFSDARRSKADFLLDGAAYYQAVIQAMEAADSSEHYIYVLGWMLEVDFRLVEHDSSKTLYAVLKAAAERGVEIRVLVWDNLLPSYAKTHQDVMPRLNKLPNTRAMVDEHTFFPQEGKDYMRRGGPVAKRILMKVGQLLGDFRPHAAPLFAEAIELKDISINMLIYRLFMFLNAPGLGAHHEKVVVVKNRTGLVGFCGGIDFNSGRVMSRVGSRTYWYPTMHDAACRLQGPAAHEILQRFKRRWHHHPLARQTPLKGENEPVPAASPAPYPYAKVVGTFNSSDGNAKDRSLRDAYMKIIENAETYIYMEDQYMVNLDVAKVLNRKIQERHFLFLILAIQDSKATVPDLFIANRKRGEFVSAIVDNVPKHVRDRVALVVIDRDRSERDKYHAGMHSKALIVDDEIAIIGSANVNQRSFTNDSETSVVVFDDNRKNDNNFARAFRIKTWEEFARRRNEDPHMITSPYNYPAEIMRGNKDFSILVRYERDNMPDLDTLLIDKLKDYQLPAIMAAGWATNYNLQQTTAILSPFNIRAVFDEFYEKVIEPVALD